MRLRTCAIAAIAALGLTLLASPATAAPATGAPATGPAPRNCVVNLSTNGKAMTCYATFTEAISKATGGRVTDASADAKAAVTDPRFAARLKGLGTDRSTIQAPFVLSIEFADDDFEGSRLIYSANWGCDDTTANTDFWVDSLPGGWNDEIESFLGFSNCWAMHFEHIFRQGGRLGWWPSSGDLFGLNDEVSSISWS